MDEIEDLHNTIKKEQFVNGQITKILKAKTRRLNKTNSNLEVLQQALEEEQNARLRAIERYKKEVFMANLKLSSLIQNLPTGVILEDSENKVLHINTKFCEFFNILTPSEMLEGLDTQDIFDLAAEMVAHAVDFRNDIANFYAQKAQAFTEGYFLTNGQVLECYYAPILSDNEITGHLWQFKDVTTRKKTEDELIKAKERAEESIKAKENFLANISHEMRTPMNGILGITDLLSKTQLDELQINYLKLIRSSGQNLLVIINDILDAAKIKSGELQLKQVIFNVVEIAATAFQLLQYKAEEKKLTYTFEPATLQHPYVTGDPHRLNQILINLLNNGIKFTNQGSVSFFISVLKETSDHLELEFKISDTGIGIAKQNLELIFEGFTQVHADADRKYGGTGLGLSISKNLVNGMGGTISVESELHKGTTFRFNLNFPKAPKPLNLPEEEIDFSGLGKVRVLLAEDNEVNLFLTQNIMERWGFEVTVALNGREALEKVSKQEFDLVLMDIQMPELNGIEATKKIRKLADPKKATLPIIALTANAFPEDYATYLANGLNDHLSKPYEEKELFKKIKSNLGSDWVAPGPVMAALPDTTDRFATEKLYDLGHLHNMCRGNEVFFNKMLKVFIDTVPISVEALEQATKIQDWQNIAELAHKLKTSFDTIRVTSLKTVLRQIESEAKKQEHIESIEKLTNKVSDTTKLLLIQLQNEVK